MLEKAVEADPDFAEAHVLLSAIFLNLGRLEKSEQHTAIALRHGDRLPPVSRYNLEGRYNSFREEDFGKAIEAFRASVDLGRCPNNVCMRLFLLERYDEAIHLFESRLEKRGFGRRGAFPTLRIFTLPQGSTIRPTPCTKRWKPFSQKMPLRTGTLVNSTSSGISSTKLLKRSTKPILCFPPMKKRI